LNTFQHGNKPFSEFEERVIHSRRVSKVVKGGRNLRFNALVIAGNKKGKIGFGIAKAVAIPDAIKKAGTMAKKKLITVPQTGTTVPHEIKLKHAASRIIIKPANPGTGVIASGPVRTIFELAGIKDVVVKTLGSRNPINVTQSVFKALQSMQMREEPKDKEINLDEEESNEN
jgi:small subunit ribosomal protein S5